MENKGLTPDAQLLLDVVLEAGKIGMKYFKSDNKVWYKDGNSPVSQADYEIDAYLKTEFAAARSDYGWLSEETEDNTDRLTKARVLIADPIDGTRGFIEGRTEWCISVAIVEKNRPIEAILHCPALEQTFLASKNAGLQIIGAKPTNTKAGEKPLVTGSKKLIERIKTDHQKSFDVMEFIPSLAYRLALVAAGSLDGAFARQGASEWDIAAADLILEEAGCILKDVNQSPIRYNQANVKVPTLIATHKRQEESIFTLAKSAGFLH